jgi:aminoglycoside 6'-N-acetyltransferase
VPSLAFTPIARADFARVGRWLTEPVVARWWHDDPSAEALEAQYGPVVDGTEPSEVFIVGLDGHPIGLIQRYALAAYPAFVAELAAVVAVPSGAYSIDYLVGEPAHRGRGVGAGLIAEFTARTFAERADATVVVVPVVAGNVASWRALERAGYRRIGQGPLTPDNPADPPDHVVYAVPRPGG